MCTQTHTITPTNTHHPPPVTPHFRKSTLLPFALYCSLLGPWLAQMAPREPICSTGMASNRNQVREEEGGKKTRSTHKHPKTWFFPLPLFSLLYWGVFYRYFHSEHAAQQVRGWNVCPPKQWGDLEEAESAIVSENGGTPATGKNTHEGCRLYMGRHATVDAKTHEQVNKHTCAGNRQKPRKNINCNLFTLCLLTHSNMHTYTVWCKLLVLSELVGISK